MLTCINVVRMSSIHTLNYFIFEILCFFSLSSIVTMNFTQVLDLSVFLAKFLRISMQHTRMHYFFLAGSINRILLLRKVMCFLRSL